MFTNQVDKQSNWKLQVDNYITVKFLSFRFKFFEFFKENIYQFLLSFIYL